MPKYQTPQEVKLSVEAVDDARPYTELEGNEFQHESFTLERPAHVAKIPEGTHTAEILKLHQTREPSFDDPNTLEDKVVVLFGTEYGTIQRTVNLRFHPKSKLGQLLQATLGEIPATINSDDLVGKKLRITVVHNEKGADVWENVTDFKRMKA